MNNNEQKKPLTEKKQWITPKVEVISSEVIQAGSNPSIPEGVFSFPFIGSGS